MIVARTRPDLARELRRLRERGGTVSLVPTMGYLHEGHLSLVDSAGELSDAVVVSVFVNPLQFGPDEDLATYPRDEDRDLALLEQRGAALAFVPGAADMYPRGEPAVTVDPGPPARRLCGAHRPGHFAGVLTVVAKLFGLVRPDVAVFGRKDFQQAVLIARMVEDLELGVRIEVAPIVREADGLAMSSRNSYLDPAERKDAAGIFAGLTAARELFAAGERRSASLVDAFLAAVARHPRLNVQYAEVVEPVALARVDEAVADSVLAVAVFCGSTRLIDNVDLG